MVSPSRRLTIRSSIPTLIQSTTVYEHEYEHAQGLGVTPESSHHHIPITPVVVQYHIHSSTRTKQGLTNSYLIITL